MNQLTREEVQEKINLTPGQLKAFATLIKAVNRCKKEKIIFYQVLDSLGALNGYNVIKIEDEISNPEKSRRYYNNIEPTVLHWLSFPCVKLTDAWADDTHFAKIRQSDLGTS